MVPNILSIAGSDPSGGAGVQADLKTFAALGCYGMAALTALTAQNTRGVVAVHAPPPEFVGAQIDAIFDDIAVAAVKTGMLGDAAIVETVADRLAQRKPPFIVVDPVLAATSGDSLAGSGVEAVIIARLFPVATLLTPNLDETARLAGLPRPSSLKDMRAAAQKLIALGARAVLIKGGDAASEVCEDLFYDGARERVFSAPRVATRNTHGTGCTLSSAIAAFLGHGFELTAAIDAAKTYVTGALETAGALDVGHGHGPLNHFFELWREAQRAPSKPPFGPAG